MKTKTVTFELFGQSYTVEAVVLPTVSITENCVDPEEYARRHGLATEYVRRLCREGRIPGAERFPWGWSIPEDAERTLTRRPSKEAGGNQAARPTE